MNTFKVKLKCLHNQNKRDALLKMLYDYHVNCSRIIQANPKLVLVYCNDSNDVDSVFSSKCISDLKVLGYEPIVPPDLRAKRSIIIKRLDSFIHGQSVENIKSELENVNSWLEIYDIYKFPKSKTLKITFVNQCMAKTAIEKGILMFRLSIPSNDIFPEEYVNLMICYQCYKWDDHLTESCQMGSHFKVCSLCSSNDHTFKDCKSESKKCINCEGSHSTLSHSCPRRRDIARKKTETPLLNTATNTRTPKYVAPPPAPPIHNQDNLNKSIVKSAMCMIMASLNKPKDNQSYQVTLNKLLTLNDLPQFKLGDISPPFLDIGNCINEITTSKLNTVDDMNNNNSEDTYTNSQNSSTMVLSEQMKIEGKNDDCTESDLISEMSSGSRAAQAVSSITPEDCKSPVAEALSRFEKLEQKPLNNDIRSKLRHLRKGTSVIKKS